MELAGNFKNRQAPQKPIEVNIKMESVIDSETLTCKCGGKVFIPGVAFKKISGLLIGSSEDQIVPIQGIFVCAKCGEISPASRRDKNLMKVINEDK